MRVIDVNVSAHQDAYRLSATIEKYRTRDRVEVFFDYSVPDARFVGATADPFAAALLLPCMWAGEPLEIEPPISPRLYVSLPRIREIFHTWWPEISRIEIHATPGKGDPNGIGSAATFFSGGVDSFYSLLKHRHGAGVLPAPLTHVIFMRGVENRLELSKGVDESKSWVQETAAASGVECITGQTNIRTSLQGPETNLHWERNYHGSALAAIALTLSPRLGYVCIPSAFSYNHLVAHGSSPLVDEMYSTERTHVIHDGSEVTRATKVARIIEWDRDLVLKYLRVCILNSGGAFNCGECYKCVRTAIPLRALGLWGQIPTFRNKSTDHWERAIAYDHLALIEENLQFARERGGDRDLISMLERVVRRRKRLQNAVAFVKNSPLDRLIPVARRMRAYLS